jgi:hypothetical protein
MPTADYLSEEFAKLKDEELIARLRSGELTDVASNTARRELTKRGLDIAQALTQPALATAPSDSSSAFNRILKRILRFPVRAVLGVEPLWTVIVFGPGFVYLVFELFRFGLVRLLLPLRPPPPYVLPLAYAGITLIALAMIWFAVALWRSARQLESNSWRIVVRVLAIVVASDIVWATPGRVSLVQQYFAAPPGGVMDSLPKS